MDNSQCSTSFSEMDCEIDVLCYDESINELKDCFNSIPEDVSAHLAKLLKDCEECISQTFDIILDLRTKIVDEKKLGGYLDNASTILKMLTQHLKNIEKYSFTCHDNKSFPTATGNIIYTVFSHCKSSEQLYGVYLKSLETQLKDLFRSCHELQLIYLMIFEKYYIVDLDMVDEQEVLLASLEINLNICDITQALDVKTMAEHWKAYTAICEKHARYLGRTDVFDKCIKAVVATVKTNMNFEQIEDKVIVRSLKVTAFAIKILSKLASTFKDSAYKHENIVELFTLVYQYKNEMFDTKATEHASLIDSLIISPTDILLKDILSEDLFSFISTIPDCKMRDMSHVIMLTSIMRQTIQNTFHVNEIKERLISHLITILPYCQTLFLKPSRLKLGDKSYGFYQYLLIHAVALASTFSAREYTVLERILFEALLRTDCCSAMFASDLWVILSRNNSQLQLNTLTGLIRSYQKLETNKMFQIAPQKHYLLHTIQKMFKHLPYDEKILVYRQCNIQDIRNDSVWTVMMVHLPDNIRTTAENIVTERCLRILNDSLKLKTLNASDVEVVIRNIKLISNCTSNQRDFKDIEMVLVNCWLRNCPSNNSLQKCLKNNRFVYLRYIEALATCTCNFVKHFQGTSIEKIIHIAFKLIEVKNNELILILFELCCELLIAVENYCFIEEYSDILGDIFLTVDKDNLQYLFTIAMSDPGFNYMISEHLKKDTGLKEVSRDFEIFKTTPKNVEFMSDPITFVHKCVGILNDDNDFEFNLSQKETVSVIDVEEPVFKKVKLDSSVTEEIVVCMESKISQLGQERAALTDEQRQRLRNVCHKLKEIVS